MRQAIELFVSIKEKVTRKHLLNWCFSKWARFAELWNKNEKALDKLRRTKLKFVKQILREWKRLARFEKDNLLRIEREMGCNGKKPLPDLHL